MIDCPHDTLQRKPTSVGDASRPYRCVDCLVTLAVMGPAVPPAAMPATAPYVEPVRPRLYKGAP